MNEYKDEFEEEMTIIEFGEWVATNIASFVGNLMAGSFSKKPLHSWISWFLAWSEYTDYMEGKNE